MYAFHLTVPAGAASVDLAFDFLSAGTTSGFSSAASATPHLAVVTWNQVVFYPQATNTDDVQVHASLTVPAGWKFATALTPRASGGDHVDFASVSLTTLVDSPVLIGQYMKAVRLDASDRPVELDMAADDPADLAISPALTDRAKRLVVEADALFGARHFNAYHFLLSLSDDVAHFGLEHHQSNDSRVYARAVVDDSPSLGVLAHEFTHSWNGKYRRPDGLATPNFQQPMVDDLLWVYEGLTQYLGYVLAARSGLWSDAYYHARLAEVAAWLDEEPGRRWRPLSDTTRAAQLLYSAPAQWASDRRGTDFYDEGWLIWLGVDTKIRELTDGRKSIDDFCRRFHGPPSTSPVVKPYTFDDVVLTLNDVAPYDWRGLLSGELNSLDAHAPLEGLTRSGWRLVYNDTPNEYVRLLETGEQHRVEAMWSLGLSVGDDGTIIDVAPGTPAFAAGLGPGMIVTQVDGHAWSPEALRAALVASEKSTVPVTLQVRNETVVNTVSIAYHGGLREPHLERTSGPDVLREILAPHAR